MLCIVHLNTFTHLKKKKIIAHLHTASTGPPLDISQIYTALYHWPFFIAHLFTANTGHHLIFLKSILHCTVQILAATPQSCTSITVYLDMWICAHVLHTHNALLVIRKMYAKYLKCLRFRFSIYCFNSANGEYGQYLLWKHFKRHRQSSRLSHWGAWSSLCCCTEFSKTLGAWWSSYSCTEYRKLWIHNTEFRIQNTAKHDDHYAVVQKTEFGDNGVGLSHQASLHSESLESFCWQHK